jgi:hypothetical protein
VAVDVATSEFAGEPQPVEIYHRGIWYTGELLGWRHDSDGRCLARVRCVVDGLRHKAWKDLSDLRLPEPPRPVLPRPESVRIHSRRTDVAPWRSDDETRPHVLLADQSLRPRPPAHALTPPPRPPFSPASPEPAYSEPAYAETADALPVPEPEVEHTYVRFADRYAERFTAV